MESAKPCWRLLAPVGWSVVVDGNSRMGRLPKNLYSTMGKLESSGPEHLIENIKLLEALVSSVEGPFALTVSVKDHQRVHLSAFYAVSADYLHSIERTLVIVVENPPHQAAVGRYL